MQDWIESVAQVPVDDSGLPPEVCIIELGGTVGDIESAPFIEAMRQFQFRVGHENFALIHVSLIPIVGAVGEQKTKPTQASVRDLRGLGLTPDFVNQMLFSVSGLPLTINCSDRLPLRFTITARHQREDKHVLPCDGTTNSGYLRLWLHIRGATTLS